jgi:hypothetical protein
MRLLETIESATFSARVTRQEGRSIPDWFIRRVCGDPPAGPIAVANAAYSAQLLEQDRETYRG